MRSFFINLYSFFALIVFIVVYLSLFPFFVVILQNEKWHKNARILNKIWSSTFYFLTGLPVFCEKKYEHKKGQPYIFCANHTSFLDISIVMLTMQGMAIFIGKSSLGKVPIFGYMFKRLHITVDRGKNKSRYDAFDKAKRKIEMGMSVVVFPEGGILTQNPPEMVPFKDGAFRAAIEKQVPVVPISIIDNWKVLPDGKNMRLHYGKTGIIYHEAISTEGMTIEDVPALKEKVFLVIQSGIQAHSQLNNTPKQEKL